MKLNLLYDELNKSLGMASIILSDKIVDEKLKNVIFMVKKDSVHICFYNALTFCRTEVESAVVDGVEEDKTWMFQVKAADLTKVLSGFSSLYKTKVEKVSFEENKSKIKISIEEVALNEEDSRLNQTSIFNLDNVPILDSVDIFMGIVISRNRSIRLAVGCSVLELHGKHISTAESLLRAQIYCCTCGHIRNH